MAYDPDTDPEIIDFRARVKQAEIDAQAKADGYMKDDQLARAKGKTPEHIDARKRTAALFCQWHLPAEPPDALQKLLDSIDYEMTVTTTNGRFANLENPKGIGILGTGRKPVYLQSKAFHPHKPEDPIYALEYFEKREK